MIVRYRQLAEDEGGQAQPAFQVFLATQQGSGSPLAIFRQTMHAQLAGDLARRLLPEHFGPLTQEVLEATAQHDWGWDESDNRQLARLQEDDPRPFPQVGPDEELPSWQRSLQFADGRPLLTRVLIRRHFCALAHTPKPGHAEFLQREKPQGERLERELGVDPAQLKRWTDALGFCDLVSLYLCSGAKAPAEFPLAHPAEPYAAQARRVVARWRGEELEFSEPVFAGGTGVSAEMLRLDGTSRSVVPERVEWRVR